MIYTYEVQNCGQGDRDVLAQIFVLHLCWGSCLSRQVLNIVLAIFIPFQLCVTFLLFQKKKKKKKYKPERKYASVANKKKIPFHPCFEGRHIFMVLWLEKKGYFLLKKRKEEVYIVLLCGKVEFHAYCIQRRGAHSLTSTLIPFPEKLKAFTKHTLCNINIL